MCPWWVRPCNSARRATDKVAEAPPLPARRTYSAGSLLLQWCLQHVLGTTVCSSNCKPCYSPHFHKLHCILLQF